MAPSLEAAPGALRKRGRDWSWVAKAVLAVVRHPTLWPTAMAQTFRLAGRGWWRRPPFLPVPDPDYLRFRLLTAYGDDRPAEPADLVTWLRWCRAWRRVARP